MQGPATCESLPSCEAVTCELPCLCEAKSEAGWSRPTPWRLRGGREKAVLPMAFGYQCLPRGSCACPWGLCTKRPAQGLFCSAVQSDLVGEERSCLLSSKSYCSGKRRRLVACLCTSALIFIICGPPETSAQRQCGPEALLTQDSQSKDTLPRKTPVFKQSTRKSSP